MEVLAQLRRYCTTHAPAESVEDRRIHAKAMEIVDQRKAAAQRHRQQQQRAARTHGGASSEGNKENSEHPSHEFIPKFFFGKRPKAVAAAAAAGTLSVAAQAQAAPDAAIAPHVETASERRVRLFQELAYSRALHLLEADIIPNAEANIASVCMALADALRADGASDDELALDYDQFCTLGEQCVSSGATAANANEDGAAAPTPAGGGKGPGEAFRQYFAATVFVQLANPADDKVGLGVLQDYMTQHQRCAITARHGMARHARALARTAHPHTRTPPLYLHAKAPSA
jgi:hypothetical protein